MKCSVAMSTYNGSRYLEEQLDSILAQTRLVDEIVISDDASTDATIEIIERYRAANPQISWKVMNSEQNQGFRKSFKRAIMHCSGELIFLCDQDDVWVREKVETMEKCFLENPKMMALISDFRTIDVKGRFLNERSAGENIWVTNRVLDARENPVRITLREMLGRNQGQGCATAIRREIAKEYVALEKDWTHDWIINLVAAMHGGLYFCKNQLFHYRLHGSNVIGMAQGEYAQRHIRFDRKIYELLLAVKYTLLQGDGDMCRKNLLNVSMDKYDFVFKHVVCCKDEEENLFAWRRFQEKRLELIEKKRLIPYLLFWLRNHVFFAENADYCTYERFVNRTMMDICAILK